MEVNCILNKNYRLKIKGIPTLVCISSTGAVSKLEDGLYDGSAMANGGLERVSSLVRDFVIGQTA